MESSFGTQRGQPPGAATGGRVVGPAEDTTTPSFQPAVAIDQFELQTPAASHPAQGS